ncbi:FG-GAP-like repeat-containing protein [Streptomyces sp. NPDC102282]|uniref:FG-GAP-like repeat-containing protein n=1 Tax=Streptomyces sp. NPDC102282 TaxID=3366154 RepID=UPI003823A09E
MNFRRSRTVRTLALLSATAAVGTLTLTSPAQAIVGTPVTGSTYAFTAQIEIGDGDTKRACTGALVDARWVLTASSCFTGGTTELPMGKPALKTVATIGRADLNATGGHVSEIVDLVPRTGRDLVMARLATPATGITPVAVATTPVAAGDTLTAAGYGRTKTEWVPDKLHTAAFTVDTTGATELGITGKTATDAICKGDTGGPLLRTVGGNLELVGVSSRSWQGGCFGETETRTGAIAARADNTVLGSRLTPGQRLLPGDTLASASAKLTMQTDGNLVITSNAGKALWSTGTTGAGATAMLNTDGNLVVRNSADTADLWEAGTSATGATAVLQDRGNFVVLNAQNVPLWSSSSARGDDDNADGRSDINAWYDYADGSDRLWSFLTQSDGTYGPPSTGYYSSPTSWQTDQMKITSGDYNGDGYNDAAVLYGYDDGSLRLWTLLGKGNGGFESPFESWRLAAGWNFANLTPHSGDFNGDGRDDLAIWDAFADGRDKLRTFSSNALGGFNAPFDSWSGDERFWNAQRSKIVVGDFDGNGRDDLAALYDYDGSSVKVWMWKSKPVGGFAEPVVSWSSTTWGDWARMGVVAGDFNGDRLDDISVWYDAADGSDSIRTLISLGNEQGTFKEPTVGWSATAGSYYYPSMKVVSGDYNGDGRDDLAAMNTYNDSSLKFWLWTSKPGGSFNTPAQTWFNAAGKWEFARIQLLGSHKN